MLPIDKIICGDNVTVMSTFPDACIDLVVTSPPYDNLRTYGGHSWDFEGVAQQLWRIIKPGGVVVWVVADATIDGSETGTSFRQALRFMEIGFRLHDTMVYSTNKPPANTVLRYQPMFEFMFVLSHGTPSAFNPIMEPCTYAHVGTSPTQRNADGNLVGSGRRTIRAHKVKGNIWHYATGSGKCETKTHPAAFPEGLARDQIMSWSNDGEVVLDPFAGSFTTCKVARLLGRRYIGIEINEAYFEIGKNRMAQRVLDFV